MTVTALATQATDIAANAAAAQAQALTNHAVAADPHGDRLLAAHLSLGRFWLPTITGSSPLLSGDSTSSRSVASVTPTLNQVTAVPLYAAEALTIRYFQVNVIAGAAGALYRLGWWTLNNQGHPFFFTLATQWATMTPQGADLGTIDCSATGLSPIISAASAIVPANTWFALGGVMQGAAAQISVGAAIAGSSGVFGSSASPPSTGSAGVALLMNGVAGAMPASFVPAAVGTLGHGIGFARVS